MDLSIPLEKLCYILLKVREFDVKAAPVDTDSGSNPGDDSEADVLEDHADDPTEEELHQILDDLNEDEALDLVALTWIGRGTYDESDWDEARAVAAREGRGHSTANYLLGMPLLADYIDEGLAAFDLSCGKVFSDTRAHRQVER